MRTYVEGCELHPVVFQIFDRKTEIRVEIVCHCLRVDSMRKDVLNQNVLDVKQTELPRVCAMTEGRGTLQTQATSNCMTQEHAAVGQREDLGGDSVDGIRVGCYMSPRFISFCVCEGVNLKAEATVSGSCRREPQLKYWLVAHRGYGLRVRTSRNIQDSY